MNVPKGKLLSIDQSRHPCYIKLEFCDTGIGIDKEELRKLFNPFKQANEEIWGDYGGTGLGLWVSQKMIQYQEGDLQLYYIRDIGTIVVVICKLRIF